ncbi:GTP-binding nuclear protein Ran [Pelomyxa schiedti]|nr:GTP-binding nuclear protein Ran [Pelomyxa schiedti]
MIRRQFKCVLIGDGGVGKSAYVRRFATGDFRAAYNSTIGVEVHNVEVNTSHGLVTFNVWDTSGQEKVSLNILEVFYLVSFVAFYNCYPGLRDAYYAGADCAIVMFDVTNKSTLRNAVRWHRDLCRICGDTIPVVWCGNKVDLNSEVKLSDVKKCRAVCSRPNPSPTPESSTVTVASTGSTVPSLEQNPESRQSNIKFFWLSAKTGHNFDKPFGWLCKELLNLKVIAVAPRVLKPLPDYSDSEEDGSEAE